MVPKFNFVLRAGVALIFFIAQMGPTLASGFSDCDQLVIEASVANNDGSMPIPLKKQEAKLAKPLDPKADSQTDPNGKGSAAAIPTAPPFTGIPHEASQRRSGPLPATAPGNNSFNPSASGNNMPSDTGSMGNGTATSPASANPAGTAPLGAARALPSNHAQNAASGASGNSEAPANADNYPIVGKMETVTFGAAHPELHIDQRLSALEEAVFKKTYNEQSLFDRTQHLKMTVLGSVEEPSDNAGIGEFGNNSISSLSPPATVDMRNTEGYFLDEVARRPESTKEIEDSEVPKFALELVNYARGLTGNFPLFADQTAQQMAAKHACDLARRNVISHASEAGENPDLRYTAIGGTDAITEGLVSLTGNFTNSQKPTKMAVALALKAMMARQDDREAILSAEATGFGFAIAPMSGKGKLVACSETSTKHGIMQPIESPIAVGDKVEVKGLVTQPYKFDRITIAWEGGGGNIPSAADEAEDALPYFPPLDYVAYAGKSEHDYEKAIATLRTVGLIAAIAGGVFMPPVALAAPMIVATGGMSEPKPLSDIPVHGGVHTEGATVLGKIPVAKGGKEGVYYVTVWASNGRGGKSVPISRRAYTVGAPAVSLDNANSAGAQTHPDTHKKKHSKHKLDTEAELEN
jgi:hypothetical protein